MSQQLTQENKQTLSERLAEARREAIANGCVTSWSINEMAVADGFSPGHIRNAIARGELRAFKVGRRVIITESERQSWLSRQVAIIKTTKPTKQDKEQQIGRAA